MYVTGHGFGHATRSAVVAQALLARGARVLVRTDAPAWLFPDGVSHLPRQDWPVDIGVAQHDGLELDIAETQRRWQEFARNFTAHARAEAAVLRAEGVNVVLADCPPLAFEAAYAAGLRSIALTNFSWDWIYADWPDFESILPLIRRAYARAEVLLRLPLHPRSPEAFEAFRQVVDVPLIARRAQRARDDVRRDLGLPLDARLVLLSFGGFDALNLPLDALATLPEYTFVLTPPLSSPSGSSPNLVCLAGPHLDYPSLLRACDLVVTKPGYGIVSDCIANRVPMLYTDRGPFAEYPVLVEAIEKEARALYIPRDDLLSGRWGSYLARLERLDRPWSERPLNGGAVVAAEVLQHGRGGRPLM